MTSRWADPDRILLVEDNDVDALLVRAMLGRGMPTAHLRRSATLADALGEIDGWRPDVVLVDLVLPDAAGAEDVVRPVLGCARSAAVVVLTGVGDDDVALRLVEDGVQDHLQKTDLEERLLVRSIRHAVARRAAEAELRRLNAELALRNHEVAEASAREIHARDQLLSNVSHELRTPLAAITGFVTVLRKGALGDLDTEVDRILERIGRNAHHLASMVDDLLDTQRAGSARLPLVIERVDPARAVEQAAETVRGGADERGVEVRVEVGAPVDDVAADPVRLVQVLVNLLSNAVKFTAAGGTVTVAASAVAASVVVTVTDTGCGIPADQVAGVFDRLRQAHDTSGGRQGLGLGLYLTRELVERQGGSVTLTSEVGVGTTVTVTLPRFDLGPVVEDAVDHAGDGPLTLVAVEVRSADLTGPAARSVAAELRRLAVGHVGPGVSLLPGGSGGRPVVRLLVGGADTDALAAALASDAATAVPAGEVVVTAHVLARADDGTVVDALLDRLEAPDDTKEPA